MKRWMKLIGAGALGATTMGASCLEVTDPLVLSLNVSNVQSTYNIPAGVTTIGSPQSCVTRNASEYAETEHNVTGGRVSDISVRTVGAFSGNVVNGSVTVNGTTVLTYSGPWSAFNEAQSILTSTLIERHPAGVTALVDAITNRQTLTVCSTGQFSEATPSGLSTVVAIEAQVEVTP